MNWQEIYSKFPIAIIVIAPNKDLLLTANQSASDLLQIPLNELKNSSLKKIFPAIFWSSIDAKSLSGIDYSYPNNDGAIRLDFSFSDLAENQFAIYLNKSQAVNNSADYESRLEAIFNEAVDGIITINRKGIIESMNPAGARLFGYTEEEVVGHNIKMLMPEPYHSEHDGYLHNYQTTHVRKIIGIGREVTAKRKDGTTFPIHLSISEIKLKDSIIYTGILHDLTLQKEAAEKIKRYAKELERSNLELQDFAYVSSHDLQEPLRKIRAFGDRLRSKEANNLSEKGLDYLDRMVNAAERMQVLINDLLSFSRVSTHAKNFVEVDLNEIIAGVLSDLELAIEQSGAIIEIEELPVIEAEPVQMRQLFQNLIGNAIKFRKENTAPHIKIKVKTIVQHLGYKLTQITIQDNGIGFDEQYKDKVFQIFQRLEGRKYEGSGIGLAICKRIATRHGGDIKASALPNVGATFTITLPYIQAKQEIIKYN